MIAAAEARSHGYPNITYHVADFMHWSPSPGGYDCVVSVAMLHHVPFEPALAKMVAALRPGGTLLLQDLVDGWDSGELLWSALAYMTRRLRRAVTTIRRRPANIDRELERVWAAHGARESYETVASVRRACDRLLPDARVRRHLMWRYSIIWTKPRIALPEEA
jgi:SAM-dependent methyltransferase